MKQIKVKDAKINHAALFMAYTITDALREATQGLEVNDLRYGHKYNGYSKAQIKNMIRMARLQLQMFINDLDDSFDWVD